MKFDIELLEICERGCRAVWEDIAPDLGRCDIDMDAETEVEACLDADRLHTFGYHDAYAAMKLLLEQGSFSDLAKAIAKTW